MNKEVLRKMAKENNNIIGIFNYCDRWCERCSFTSRCLSYKMEAKKKKSFFDGYHTQDENTLFWESIEESFDMARELIREFAQKEGIDIDHIQRDSVQVQQQNDIENMIKSHAVIVAAEKYLNFVNEWLDNTEHLFTSVYNNQEKVYSINLSHKYKHLDPLVISDAIEVVRWYQYQISVKLSRALHSKENEKVLDQAELNEVQSDADGSAKVAMIGIDRSIGAWNVLLSGFPAEEGALLNVLVCLERLRKAVEKEFPDARGFTRPGFDEIND